MLALSRWTPRALFVALVLHTAAFSSTVLAQHPPEQPDAAKILHDMQKLEVVGSVLYIAAHPDDENTRLIAWLANGKKVRTGYLSLTRGDGGQNLLGSELGDGLGIIRTQELLEARRLDGGEQFFTRAVDFGFSKNAKESFEKWGKQEVLSDVVRVIRTFRPDVIITRFPPTREAGHGHHEASAILAAEAFDMAGDPKAFPEQLEQGLTVWQPKRLLFNGSTWWRKDLADIVKKDPDWITVDVGGYDPLLGLSYSELAGRSRSMHKSQGFGAEQKRGETLEYLHLEKGDHATDGDPLSGINTTWTRVVGGEAIGTQVHRMIQGYDMQAPERSVEALLAIHTSISTLPPSVWKDRASKRVEDLLLATTGTVIDALSNSAQVVTDDPVSVTVNAVTRSNAPLSIVHVAANDSAYDMHGNVVLSLKRTLKAPSVPDAPYWLQLPHGNLHRFENTALIGQAVTPQQLQVEFDLQFENNTSIHYRAPVLYHWIDRVKGEQVSTCYVVPPVSVHASPSVVMVHDATATAHIGIDAFTDLKSAKLMALAVADWDITPREQDLGPMAKDERRGADLTLRPQNATRRTEPDLALKVDHTGPTNLTRRMIAYDHIMPQTWYTSATYRAVPVQVTVTSKRIGYIKGAGDEVPEALGQLGLIVDMIDPATAKAEDLVKYDAIVVGIRAYNTVKAMKYFNDDLMKYVNDGGTVVVQYTTNGDDMVMDAQKIGPYPFKITRDRVTVEEAPPTFLDPTNALLNTPNKITSADFDGWIQERGLYFLGDLDPHYTPLLAWNDPGEQPLNGALVACDYGKGRYVYTGISFFRELPAGVPGAYRLFANLISKRGE